MNQIKSDDFDLKKRCFIPQPIEWKDPGSGPVIAVALGDLDTFVEAFGQRRIHDAVRHQMLANHHRHLYPRYLAMGDQGVSVWLTLSADCGNVQQKREVLAYFWWG